MEAVCLGLFMISAGVFATVLEYPNSIIHQLLPNVFTRLVIMGIAMGITATLLNYSPMGKLSGAHMNPAVTFTFVRLTKIKLVDAIYYVLFQCLGGTAGVVLMSTLVPDSFRDPHVNYIITAPGKFGVGVAFVLEVFMAFSMMIMVLTTTNHPRYARYTGLIAGMFVASFVILSAPISGFSINPARTIASAIPGMQFPSFWIYMTAPFIGMLGAAEVFTHFKGKAICAKMHHVDTYLCIFNCGYCLHNHSATKHYNE
jgi:aquaporin Z